MSTYIEVLNKADESIHPVESEWHHEDLTAAGFVPETKEAKGFVRRYIYKHPSGVVVTMCTGVNADYWSSTAEGSIPANGGYWSALKPYLNRNFMNV
jgi:hypothetical protein